MKMGGWIAVLSLALFWPVAVLAQDDGVARAQFTTAVEDREPTDRIDRLGVEHDRISFFTELRGLEGRTVTHRWVYDRSTEASVEFEVGGPRWRVWSTKQLIPDQTGEWTVLVSDDTGRLHGAWSFDYGEE